MSSHPPNRLDIVQLVHTLGEAGGTLPATPQQVQRLREFFGLRVLRPQPDAYILSKFHEHVEGDEQWPTDTTPEEFLGSLRDTVLDPRTALYLTDDGPDQTWTLYFVGRVRRAWRGPAGSNRIVVIFNAERFRFVTGFQPDEDDDYIESLGGFWLRQS
jgi:hypothetical protein